MENLLDWYVLKAESSQSDPIVRITQQEREVVAKCLKHFEQALKEEWLHGWRWTVNWIKVVQGVLIDGPLSRRLGARNDIDLGELIDLLVYVGRRYPRVFSDSFTEPVQRELRKEIAAIPPPASRRFTDSEDETRDLTDRALDAFSWRTLPESLWRKTHYDAEQFEKEFRPVPPREFDFEVFGSDPFLGNGDNMHVMTDETQLHYLPTFLSLIVED